MKGGGHLALAPLLIAQALVGFGAVAAFTRLMSAEEFGLYALALSLSMAAHTVLFTWAEAAAFRYFTAAQAGRRLADHYATLIAIALVLGLATLLATSILVTRIGLPEDAAALAAFAAGAAILRFLTRTVREGDRAARAFGRYAFMESLYLVIGFAAGLAFLVVTDLGAAAPFAGLALGGAVVAMIDAPRLLARAQGGCATLTRARRYAAYGAPLALALAVDLGVQALARLILAGRSGTAELGAYAAAFGLARPLDLIFLGLSAAAAPLVFAAYEEKGADHACAAARGMFATLAAVALPACVGLVLVSEPLTALVIGEQLRDEAAKALPWLALAGLFCGFTLYYWSEAFQLTQRTGLRAVLMLIPGGVQLLLTYLFAAEHGAVGAAVAAAVGAFIGCLLLTLAGRRLIALPLPSGALARTLAATALMAAGLAALPAPADTFALALYVAAGAGFYAIAALAFNVLDARARAAAGLRALAARFAGALPAPSTDSL